MYNVLSVINKKQINVLGVQSVMKQIALFAFWTAVFLKIIYTACISSTIFVCNCMLLEEFEVWTRVNLGKNLNNFLISRTTIFMSKTSPKIIIDEMSVGKTL